MFIHKVCHRQLHQGHISLRLLLFLLSLLAHCCAVHQVLQRWQILPSQRRTKSRQREENRSFRSLMEHGKSDGSQSGVEFSAHHSALHYFPGVGTNHDRSDLHLSTLYHVQK